MIKRSTAMLGSELKPRELPPTDTRKSFLSLRWLLIILSGYLTLFSYVGTREFLPVFFFAVLFAVTNLVFSLLPACVFETSGLHRTLDVADVIFCSATFYFLNQAGTYLFLPFMLVFVLAIVWRELKVVLFSLLVVSLLYGLFRSFRLMLFDIEP